MNQKREGSERERLEEEKGERESKRRRGRGEEELLKQAELSAASLLLS